MKFLIIFLLLPLLAIAQSDNNISIISLDQYNIVYRGIPNKIKIAVPSSKSFTATAPGLTKDTLGNYRLNAGKDNEVKIEIDAIMADNSKIHEEKAFRIKGLPALSGALNGNICSYCIYEMPKKCFY